MRKLLIICGQTATGKTKLALKLASKFGGELISADSRQVYTGFNIGTGKDIPPSFKMKYSDIAVGNRNIPFYTNGKVKIWGYDLAEPNEDFNVSSYKSLVSKIIRKVYKSKKLPIIVGGTGFYIKALTDPIDTLNVPRNTELRKSLAGKNAKELYELLAVKDPIKAGSMNKSDSKNPRRLVRAIEVADYNNVGTSKMANSVYFDKVLKIGLIAPKLNLKARINERVNKRLKDGFEREFVLLAKKYSLNTQAFSSLGYHQWAKYYKSLIKRKNAINLWIKDEQKYAKKQLVWFKKDKQINWFDITDKTYPENLVNFVQEWYKIKN